MWVCPSMLERLWVCTYTGRCELSIHAAGTSLWGAALVDGWCTVWRRCFLLPGYYLEWLHLNSGIENAFDVKRPWREHCGVFLITKCYSEANVWEWLLLTSLVSVALPAVECLIIYRTLAWKWPQAAALATACIQTPDFSIMPLAWKDKLLFCFRTSRWPPGTADKHSRQRINGGSRRGARPEPFTLHHQMVLQQVRRTSAAELRERC